MIRRDSIPRRIFNYSVFYMSQSQSAADCQVLRVFAGCTQSNNALKQVNQFFKKKDEIPWEIDWLIMIQIVSCGTELSLQLTKYVQYYSMSILYQVLFPTFRIIRAYMIDRQGHGMEMVKLLPRAPCCPSLDSLDEASRNVFNDRSLLRWRRKINI